MGTHITWGSASLGPSGLVAFMSCGHWWAYPVHATAEQLHEVAKFNRRLLCGFCLADWQDDTYVPARGTATRVN
jgi:hypothetical protein